jgi:hypothetical protein
MCLMGQARRHHLNPCPQLALMYACLLTSQLSDKGTATIPTSRINTLKVG